MNAIIVSLCTFVECGNPCSIVSGSLKVKVYNGLFFVCWMSIVTCNAIIYIVICMAMLLPVFNVVRICR